MKGLSSPDVPEGFTLDYFDSVGSTSDILKQRADEGAPDGTAVRAGEQRGGRGRHGRGWTSPPGNLYLSVLLREAVPVTRLPELSFVAAVAMGEAVSALMSDHAAVTFKWPNDLLIGGAKCCGLLLEAGGTEGPAPWVVIGSGVNIASHPSDTPYPATNLRAAGLNGEACVHDDLPAVLAVRYLDGLSRWRDRWRRQGFAPIRATWRAAAHRVGEEITVRLGETKVNGAFVDMDDTGGLVLDIPGQGQRTVTAGEVVRA